MKKIFYLLIIMTILFIFGTGYLLFKSTPYTEMVIEELEKRTIEDKPLNAEITINPKTLINISENIVKLDTPITEEDGVKFIAPYSVSAGWTEFNIESKYSLVDIILALDSADASFTQAQRLNPTTIYNTRNYICDEKNHYEIDKDIFRCFTTNETDTDYLIFQHSFETNKDNSITWTESYVRDWEDLTLTKQQTETATKTLTSLNNQYTIRTPLNAGNNKIRVFVDIPRERWGFKKVEAEYWIIIKPVEIDLATAISKDYYIDPWINSTGTAGNYSHLETGQFITFDYPRATNSSSPEMRLGINNLTTTGVIISTSQKIIGDSFQGSATQNNQLIGANTLNETNNNPFSMSMWARLTDVSGSFQLYDFREDRNTEVFIKDGKMGGEIGAYYSADWGVPISFLSATWYHIVFTYNGTTFLVYVNGTYVFMKEYTILTSTGTKNTIGIQYDNAFDFVGNIDEFYIWNDIILNQSDIDMLYNNHLGSQWNSTAPAPPAPPVPNGVNATLIYPIDYYNTSSNDVEFYCIGDTLDVSGLLNMTLIIDDVNNYTIYNTTAPQNLTLNHTLSIAEGNHNWTCSASSSINTTSATARRFTIDQTAPIINITSPGSIKYLDKIYQSSKSINITWNITEPNIDKCILWNGTNNVTLNCSSNKLALNVNYGNNTLILYANDTTGNANSQTINPYYIYAFDLGSYVSNFTGNATDLKGMYLDLSYNSSMMDADNFSVALVYNNTYYNLTKTESGTDLAFDLNLTLPSDVGVYPFYWMITHYVDGFSDYNSTYTFIPDEAPGEEALFYYSTISKTGLEVSATCPGGTISAYNFTFYNETNRDLLNGSVDYVFYYGIYNTTGLSINGTLNDIEMFSICLNVSQPYYIVNYGELQYISSYNTERRYYLFSGTRLNSTSINIPLYSLATADTTNFLLTAKSTSLVPYENYYVGLMRWYPEINSYKVVEMGKTDKNGQTILGVKTQDVDYRLAIYETDGTLVQLNQAKRFICQTNPCTYTFFVDETPLDLTTFTDIEGALSFDTDTFTFIWNDPSQAEQQINLTIYQETALSRSIICSSVSSTAYTGVLDCNVSGYSGRLKAEVTRTASPGLVIAQLYKEIKQTIIDVGGGSLGLFMGAIILIFFALIGAVSPILVVILGMISLIPLWLIGSIQWGLLMAIGVIGGLILHFMRRVQ